MILQFEPNFIKNSLGKVVFQSLTEIEMMRNENRLFSRHFETVQIFCIFPLKYGCECGVPYAVKC